MIEKREKQKRTKCWSRSFYVIFAAVTLWAVGDVAQPQATGCQVGTYDCAGQLYLLTNGNVGIGTNAPGQKLDVVGTTQTDYLIVNAQDGVNEGGEIRIDGTGGFGNFQIDNYQGNARIHTLGSGKELQVLGGGGYFQGSVRLDGELAISGKHAFRGYDAWLRLNQDGAFSSGVHTPGLLYPGSLNVGGLSINGGTHPGTGNAVFSGGVGIGTAPGSAKLNVQATGTIGARVSATPGNFNLQLPARNNSARGMHIFVNDGECPAPAVAFGAPGTSSSPLGLGTSIRICAQVY